jgi:hypothetical protein
VSKTAALILAFFCIALFPAASHAQLIPHGNVYVGASYGELVDVTTRYPFKGWNASVEALPFARYPSLGLVLDGSGFYNRGHGIHQYNAFLGPRLSRRYGKWRPFVQAMAGFEIMPVNGISYHPFVYDIGGGVDYKLFFKSFSWRVQGDFMRSHLLSAYQNDARGSTGIVWRF